LNSILGEPKQRQTLRQGCVWFRAEMLELQWVSSWYDLQRLNISQSTFSRWNPGAAAGPARLTGSPQFCCIQCVILRSRSPAPTIAPPLLTSAARLHPSLWRSPAHHRITISPRCTRFRRQRRTLAPLPRKGVDFWASDCITCMWGGGTSPPSTFVVLPHLVELAIYGPMQTAGRGEAHALAKGVICCNLAPPNKAGFLRAHAFAQYRC